MKPYFNLVNIYSYPITLAPICWCWPKDILKDPSRCQKAAGFQAEVQRMPPLQFCTGLSPHVLTNPVKAHRSHEVLHETDLSAQVSKPSSLTPPRFLSLFVSGACCSLCSQKNKTWIHANRCPERHKPMAYTNSRTANPSLNSARTICFLIFYGPKTICFYSNRLLRKIKGPQLNSVSIHSKKLFPESLPSFAALLWRSVKVGYWSPGSTAQPSSVQPCLRVLGNQAMLEPKDKHRNASLSPRALFKSSPQISR